MKLGIIFAILTFIGILPTTIQKTEETPKTDVLIEEKTEVETIFDDFIIGKDNHVDEEIIHWFPLV